MTAPWYRLYIRGHHWRSLRRSIFRERGRSCEKCGFRYRLTLHHLSYRNLGHESGDDLQILCWQCHRAVDHRNIAGIKVIYRLEPPDGIKGLLAPATKRVKPPRVRRRIRWLRD